MSLKKLNFICTLLFVLPVMLAACSTAGSAEATPTPLPPLVSYEKTVFTVEKGPIVSETSVVGEVVPSRQDELFFRTSGYVTRVTVKVGDVVKAGDLLAEMQVDDLLNQLEQARIDLEVAQANLARKESDRKYAVARAEIDVDMATARVELAKLDLESVYTQKDKTRAQLNLDLTESSLALAQLALEQSQEDASPYEEQAVSRNQLAVERLEGLIAERQVVAPYDGVILRARARAGQSADAFTVLFTIGDPTDLVIRTAMNNELRNTLTEDTEVYMALNSEAEDRYPIKFQPYFILQGAVATEVETFTGTQAEYLYFTMPETWPDDGPILSRSIVLDIILGRKEDALLLPPAAVRNYRGLYFVIKLEGEQRRRVEIYEIGLTTPDRWEIIGDLQEGDQVLGP